MSAYSPAEVAAMRKALEPDHIHEHETVVGYDEASKKYTITCLSYGCAFSKRVSKGEAECHEAYVNQVVERAMAEAYYDALQKHLRAHGCAHDFADVAESPEIVA